MAEELFDQQRIVQRLANQLNVSPSQVESTIQLLDDGNSLPFIARYRKEVTKGLDEQQIRVIEDELTRMRELATRKKTVLKTIDEQGALTDQLRQRIINCVDRQLLEDLYLPFKPKRKTRATVAREKGLQPLADLLLQQRGLPESVDKVLERFVSEARDVSDAEAALAGACDIVAEVWAEDAELRQWVQERARRGRFVCSVKRGKQADGEKFNTYFDYSEKLDRMPSHRFLAMKRGEAEGVLRLGIEPDEDYVMPRLQQRLVRNANFEFASILRETVSDCYKRLLKPAAESSLMQQLKSVADEEAISVFAKNMRQLLLAAPVGPHVTVGIDPGFRTGCKVAVVDETGRFLENTTIYPTAPRNDTEGAAAKLLQLIRKHHPEFIAIGNGTASRETEAFVGQVIKSEDLQIKKVVVSEAGASVYSASELAAKEYPDLDLTVRGAISIAHRLQDPLAELVKIDPRAVGVGQYQHDVNQASLQKALDREVESCVTSVGVDVNMASASLLSYVSGIGPATAKKIVEYRDTNGSFRTRKELLKVPKLGPKAFEQSAGFLRIRDGKEPLDNSAVHPESYSIVAGMARRVGVAAEDLVGNQSAVDQLQAGEFKDDSAGEYTLRDILAELARPGRDPRSEFKAATFATGVDALSDLTVGMRLEGQVTNVTHFGAFVVIGVHQDGLIHISQLADHFVKDPAQEVAVGDVVEVTVLEVDEQRKRVSLSRKSDSKSV
jgi:uncharacterized protein